MTTLQIELPDGTAQAAQAAGLLTPQALDRLLNEALRKREAANSLLSIADRVAAAGIAPMTMQEIQAEVKAARAERGPSTKVHAGSH
jgi:predicted proteasome-type protease